MPLDTVTSLFLLGSYDVREENIVPSESYSNTDMGIKTIDIGIKRLFFNKLDIELSGTFGYIDKLTIDSVKYDVNESFSGFKLSGGYMFDDPLTVGFTCSRVKSNYKMGINMGYYF